LSLLRGNVPTPGEPDSERDDKHAGDEQKDQ
jgi:hypothetical protein